MIKYQFRDGTPYDGPTIKTPDGRILSGATYTKHSKRLEEIEDGSECGGKLHEANPAKEVVQPSEKRSKGRGKRSVVSKKSPKTSTAL